MTPEEQIEYAIRFAIANVELEGYVVDDDLRRLIRLVAEGKMSAEDALRERFSDLPIE